MDAEFLTEVVIESTTKLLADDVAGSKISRRCGFPRTLAGAGGGGTRAPHTPTRPHAHTPTCSRKLRVRVRALWHQVVAP